MPSDRRPELETPFFSVCEVGAFLLVSFVHLLRIDSFEEPGNFCLSCGFVFFAGCAVVACWWVGSNRARSSPVLGYLHVGHWATQLLLAVASPATIAPHALERQRSCDELQLCTWLVLGYVGGSESGPATLKLALASVAFSACLARLWLLHMELPPADGDLLWSKGLRHLVYAPMLGAFIGLLAGAKWEERVSSAIRNSSDLTEEVARLHRHTAALETVRPPRARPDPAGRPASPCAPLSPSPRALRRAGASRGLAPRAAEGGGCGAQAGGAPTWCACGAKACPGQAARDRPLADHVPRSGVQVAE